MGPQTGRRHGFTLVELLVVITIILIVSAVALPTVIPALQHREVSAAARILQAALAGARDTAIRDNAPSGIRLLPDPTFTGLNTATGTLDPTVPLAYNRIIPIQAAPEYNDGFLTIPTPRLATFNAVAPLAYPVGSASSYPYPSPSLTGSYSNGQVLMVAEVELAASGAPNIPTAWFWNVRVGDKMQVNNAGPWYTVVGPMAVGPIGGNSEMFVNVGMPGSPIPLQLPQGGQNVNPQFLFLVNGQDDNANGWVDEGWDGVDNNGNGIVDELAEWENEVWLGSSAVAMVAAQAMPYTIRRRPMPVINAREVSLPTGVVIDATSWSLTNERTRVPGAAFNQFTGFIDVLLNPDGSVVPTTLYSSPSSLGMGGAFYHFWLAERSDVYPPVLPLVTGYSFALPMPLGAISQAAGSGTYTPNAYDALVASNPALPIIKGENRIVTLFTRTGQVTTNENPTFNVLNVNQPFIEAQQGVASR